MSVEINLGEYEHGFTAETDAVNADLKQRIKRAYRLSSEYYNDQLSPLWAMIVGKNRAVHDALVDDDSDLSELEDPSKGYLFYGFDNLFIDFTSHMQSDAVDRRRYASQIFAEFVKLCEIIGIQRIWNPEGGNLFPYKDKPEVPSLEYLLEQLDNHVGTKITFPNPFPHEFGLQTSRGIMSQRAIQAIYQAIRLRDLSRQYGSRVAEIGAGLGRTAYYAHQFGIDDYTIIDLPMVNVAQATFLGAALPEQDISFNGESNRRKINIRPAHWFDRDTREFDVFLNADSLTEMSVEIATNYAHSITRKGRAFLSINQEANTHRVSDIECLRDSQIYRYPYWLRDGYVEELFVFNKIGRRIRPTAEPLAALV